MKHKGIALSFSAFVAIATLVTVSCISFFLGAAMQRDKDDTIMRYQREGIFSEPDYCRLCTDITYHAPCILDLSWGQYTQMSVYPIKNGDYAQVDTERTAAPYSFGSWGDYVDYTLVDEVYTATIKKSTKDMSEAFFCNPCRERIRAYVTEGLILVDALDRENIALYPLATATYTIRDYTVDITKHGDTYTVIVTAQIKE